MRKTKHDLVLSPHLTVLKHSADLFAGTLTVLLFVGMVTTLSRCPSTLTWAAIHTWAGATFSFCPTWNLVQLTQNKNSNTFWLAFPHLFRAWEHLFLVFISCENDFSHAGFEKKRVCQSETTRRLQKLWIFPLKKATSWCVLTSWGQQFNNLPFKSYSETSDFFLNTVKT